MSSSVPLATLTPHPGDQSGPSALPEQPPSNPLPTQAEQVANPNAESSSTVASAVPVYQSYRTVEADEEPWR